MSAYDFVLNIWTHAQEKYDELITDDTASEIISYLAEDDRIEFPEDLTPSLFASVWNELVSAQIKDNE